MNDKPNHIELLLENAADYGKTSFELLKLKALDKSSDVVSSIVPIIIVFVLIMSFFFFVSFGFAFWFGELFGKVYYGFFIVAAFYGIVGFIIHFCFRKRLKRLICNYIIKITLN